MTDQKDLAAAFYEHCGRRIVWRCPCCDHLELESRGDYEICGICYWEDDGTEDVLAPRSPFSPNHVTLAEGRANYVRIGACDPKILEHVEAATHEQASERAAYLATHGT